MVGASEKRHPGCGSGMGRQSADIDIIECEGCHHIVRIEIEKIGNHECTAVIICLRARVNVNVGLVRSFRFGV